jgi:hypothetical protein
VRNTKNIETHRVELPSKWSVSRREALLLLAPPLAQTLLNDLFTKLKLDALQWLVPRRWRRGLRRLGWRVVRQGRGDTEAVNVPSDMRSPGRLCSTRHDTRTGQHDRRHEEEGHQVCVETVSVALARSVTSVCCAREVSEERNRGMWLEKAEKSVCGKTIAEV